MFQQYNCPQGVTALGHNPQFRNLVLAECSEITDLGMEVCPQLNTLLPGLYITIA